MTASRTTTGPNNTTTDRTSAASAPRPESGVAAWRRPRVAVAALAIVVAAVVLVVSAATGLVPWRDYVERRPPSYLQLAFTDPASLPSHATTGQPVGFAFDVVNPAPRARTIHWVTRVRDVATGTIRDAGAGSVVVPQRGQVRTPQTVTLDQVGREQVLVTVDGGELIAFFVTVDSAASSGSAGT